MDDPIPRKDAELPPPVGFIENTPEALAKSPHVQALVKAAVEAERERVMPNDRAIQDLADYFWRVHPNEIGEQGYDHVSRGGKYENPRAAWYADQIKALCRAAAIREVKP